MNKITIIDYKMGNIASLINSFKAIGVEAKIATSPEEIIKSNRLVLPGVGAFNDAANHLKDSGFDDAIKEFIKSGKYLLGVCLGMQLLFKESEESRGAYGLDLIPGEVIKFNKDSRLKIPHMGWNRVDFKESESIFKGLNKPLYLYFVHSYYVKCNKGFIIGSTQYGNEFASAVRYKNIYGIQPHPEKSHDNGLKIIKNFMELS